MVQIINPTKVGLAEPEEGFDLDLLNGNFQKLNDLLPVVSRVNSAVNGNTIDLRASTFTKFKVGTLTFVVADFKATIKSGQTLSLPANFNTPLNIAGVVPVGYQPRTTLNMQQGPVLSGEGRGDNLQGGISSVDLLLRMTGAALDRASNGNVVLTWNVAYAAVD